MEKNIELYLKEDCDYKCKVCPRVDECFSYTMDNAIRVLPKKEDDSND